jgi:hypothetical protein
MSEGRVGASFRDPSGFVFKHEGEVYRQVNRYFKEDWAYLDTSGLYSDLTDCGYLVPYEMASTIPFRSEEGIAVIKPERVPTISYPYEWCFSQLKDAALVTLEIQKRALDKGMSLKDANAQNIQFLRGRPILIDSLSFERYRDGMPWIAYRQFCQHFVAPLVLMGTRDVRLGRLLEVYPDGIPLDLASGLSPGSTKLKPWILTHLHLHAKAQKSASSSQEAAARPSRPIAKNSLLGLVDSLKSLVSSLEWKPEGTVWADYYDHTNYSSEAMKAKHDLVGAFADAIEGKPRTAWDLGANTGEFSRPLTQRGISTVAWDVDPAAVERAYRKAKADGETLLLPLLQDLTMPSPAAGWANRERMSLAERGPVDLLLALALVHHLAIGNNVPLPSVAEYFATLGEWLIIEFVPKEDSQVRRMLSSREDVFPSYTQPGFEAAFSSAFQILRQEAIPGTERTLYLMRRSGP